MDMYAFVHVCALIFWLAVSTNVKRNNFLIIYKGL
jgi:hypothetical protein